MTLTGQPLPEFSLQDDQGGTVTRKDLILLLSPTVALGISETAELQQYVVNNQFALGQLKGGVPGQNAAFGLPDQLYGYKVEVMSETYNSANRGAADSVSFFAPENGAIVLARPGGLVIISFVFYPYEAPSGAGVPLRGIASKDACATKY